MRDQMNTDIAVKPIFLPLVHQLARYLAHYEPATSWYTVGQVLDLTARGKGRAGQAPDPRRGRRSGEGDLIGHNNRIVHRPSY